MNDGIPKPTRGEINKVENTAKEVLQWPASRDWESAKELRLRSFFAWCIFIHYCTAMENDRSINNRRSGQRWYW